MTVLQPQEDHNSHADDFEVKSEIDRQIERCVGVAYRCRGEEDGTLHGGGEKSMGLDGKHGAAWGSCSRCIRRAGEFDCE